MLLNARASVYPAVKATPCDRRRRRPTISASYSLFPTLRAGRFELAFGFRFVPIAFERMRGFDRLPGMRWLRRTRVFMSRARDYTTSALTTVSAFSSCDQPALVWIGCGC